MDYHYINKEMLKDEETENRIGHGIDLWGTSSLMYANLNSFTKKITKDKRFELIEFNKMKSNIKNVDSMKFIPKIGDLLYRKWHVEFYVGHNKTIGWGRVHKTCVIEKKYCIDEDGIKSNDPEDKNIPYTTIIRFMGGANEK